MQFDLTDLRLFLAVAGERNITRAATSQHLSLAAASARVKALEQQAGLPLFVREARGVRLTPPGESFLYHAREVLRQAEILRRDLHEFGSGLRGYVRVFANTTAVTDFLPELLPAFLAANPRINVDLQERPNSEIAREIREGRADIGIVAGQTDFFGLDAIHFSTDRLVLITARGHAFARRKRISFSEILEEDFIGMHYGSTIQTFLEQQAERLGKSMRLRVQLRSFDAMCRMVAAGVGVAIAPESIARRSSPAKLAVVDLADSWCVRERFLLVRDHAALPSYGRDLVELIQAHYRN